MHANTMGNFVGEQTEVGMRARKNLCACGAQKHHEARECQTCHNIRNNASRYGPRSDEMIAERQRRHHRFEAALEAGWTLGELWMLCRAGRLPTRQEINERDPSVAVRYWPDVVIKSCCRGMG